MRKRKLEERLVQVLRHDYGFYNAIFKWQGLPPPLDTSFDSLLPFLRRLEQKGIIRLFTIEGEQMIEVIRCPYKRRCVISKGVQVDLMSKASLMS